MRPIAAPRLEEKYSGATDRSGKYSSEEPQPERRDCVRKRCVMEVLRLARR
jgi:hypothetical protein